MSEKVRRVTRNLLRKQFADGKWRTVDDMAYALATVVSPDAASRLCERSRLLKGLPLDERIHRGLKQMIHECALPMYKTGTAERREEDDLILYRFLSAGAVAEMRAKARKAKEEARLAALAATPVGDDAQVRPTKGDREHFLGLCRETLFRDLRTHPGTTAEEAYRRLGHLLKVDACRDWMLKDSGRKGTMRAGAIVGKSDDAIRRWAVARMLQRVVTEHYARKEKVTRYYLKAEPTRFLSPRKGHRRGQRRRYVPNGGPPPAPAG